MRRALQATAAASRVSVTGAGRNRGQDNAGLAQQRAALVTAGLGVLAVRQRRARHGAECELRMYFVERVAAGSRYRSASSSFARRPQAWMLKPWPVSARQRSLAAW